MFNKLILADRLDLLNHTLVRIADALERAYPEPDLSRLSVRRTRGPEAIIRYGDEKREWMKENFQELIHQQGLPPGVEAELLGEALAVWSEKEPDLER